MLVNGRVSQLKYASLRFIWQSLVSKQDKLTQKKNFCDSETYIDGVQVKTKEVWVIARKPTDYNYL